MLRRRGQRVAQLASAFLSVVSALEAQTVASLGVGGSIVEYDGFLTSAAAAFTPALQFDAANLAVGAQGNWTIFESGNQVFQATGAAGWLADLHDRWRLEFSSTGGFSKYADEAAVGHLLARSRLHFFGTNYGGWLGATAGAAFDSSTVAPFEFSVGVWAIQQRMTLVGIVTSAWLGDNRHVDIAGAARWTTKRLEWEARVGMRPWTVSSGDVGEAVTGVWGEVSALIPLSSAISLTLSGGSYPSDPVRRVLGANYLTAGFRIATSGGAQLPVLVDPAPILAAARMRTAAANTSQTRIEILSTDSMHAIRVFAAGATSVEIMGDFTDWQPLALTQAGTGIWEIQRPLTRGVHRLNVRVNGGAWLVPEGARQEQDEFGSVVGIIVIH